ATSETPPVPQANLKTMADVAHDYQSATTASARAELIRTLRRHNSVSIALRSDGNDPKQARLIGLAFSVAPHAGWFVPLPSDAGKAATMLSEFRLLLEDERIEKVGHDLKFTLSAFKWNGLSVRGKLFDVMLAHALIEPDLRHTLEFLAEVHLGYSPASAGRAAGGQTELGHEHAIYRLADTEFNLNSPKQLGEILFDRLKIAHAPKKTRTGQYATDEQTLITLGSEHEIVRRLLEYRECAKLKSTYADALPAAIFPRTGRVHTTLHQLATATGRLNSQHPNLQNIPIRSRLGPEIRTAAVASD